MSQAIRAKNKLGYEHYVCYPDDGRRHEIIDGDHYVNPAPNTGHQRFSSRIQYQLHDQIEETGRGAVFTAPTDVQLTEHDIVQPDLIIVMEERRLIITPAKIKGAPNLIIEILSPSTEANDRFLKRDIYERANVPEYWIVDPDEHVVEQFVMQNGKYELAGSHGKKVTVATIDNVTIDLTKVW
jgi:Uma2 family endonuclease